MGTEHKLDVLHGCLYREGRDEVRLWSRMLVKNSEVAEDRLS